MTDRATQIIRLQRKRDELAARVAIHNPHGPRKDRVFVQGITRLRVRLEQACHDLMKLELKQ
jgi:hypothetical protein